MPFTLYSCYRVFLSFKQEKRNINLMIVREWFETNKSFSLSTFDTLWKFKGDFVTEKTTGNNDTSWKWFLLRFSLQNFSWKFDKELQTWELFCYSSHFNRWSFSKQVQYKFEQIKKKFYNRNFSIDKKLLQNCKIEISGKLKRYN